MPNPARPHPTGATPAPPPGLCARDRTEEAVTTHRHRNRHNPAPNGTGRADTPGRSRALHWVGRARPTRTKPERPGGGPGPMWPAGSPPSWSSPSG